MAVGSLVLEEGETMEIHHWEENLEEAGRTEVGIEVVLVGEGMLDTILLVLSP